MILDYDLWLHEQAVKWHKASEWTDSILQLCNSDSLRSVVLLEYLAKCLPVEHEPEVTNFIDQNGLSLLHHAARNQSPEFCKVLVDMDPFTLLRAACNKGQLPLHESCISGNLETTKFLLSMYPESIKIPNNEGYYPLHISCKNGNVGTAKLFDRHVSGGHQHSSKQFTLPSAFAACG